MSLDGTGVSDAKRLGEPLVRVLPIRQPLSHLRLHYQLSLNEVLIFGQYLY